MKKTCKKSGLTLTEMAVVAAIIGLLVALGIPAIRTVMHSFESESGARAMVSSALASARAIAARNQEYAGIRFQPDADGRQHISSLFTILRFWPAVFAPYQVLNR